MERTDPTPTAQVAETPSPEAPWYIARRENAAWMIFLGALLLPLLLLLLRRVRDRHRRTKRFEAMREEILARCEEAGLTPEERRVLLEALHRSHLVSEAAPVISEEYFDTYVASHVWGLSDRETARRIRNKLFGASGGTEE